MMVLNNPPKSHDNPGGFCYRCVFPKPPPADTVLSCGDGGILGPVVGVMGVLMAMEALKILTSPLREQEYENSTETPHVLIPPSLLLYSAYSNPQFRSIRLRGKRKECPSCSATATITEESFKSTSCDCTAFCASSSPAPQTNTTRISAKEYSKVQQATETPHILVDVREKVQFEICHLKGSINIPYSDIAQDPEACIDKLDDTINNYDNNPSKGNRASLYLICRYGNDSQLAANTFKTLPRFQSNARYDLRGDIAGGLRAWRESVDPQFPEY